MIGRNPFFMRFSEEAIADTQFLRLFSAEVLSALLDALPTPESLWGRVTVIRSSPGGGKTSLLRLFTPTALHTLHTYRSVEQFKDLFARVQQLGAVDDSGPLVLGSLLKCAYDFALLEDFSFSSDHKRRLLLCLLNARIILSILRSALITARLRGAEDLVDIAVAIPGDTNLPENVRSLVTGQALWEWASTLERQVCGAINGEAMAPSLLAAGHNALFSLFLMGPGVLSFKGAALAHKVLLLLDDFQALTLEQRKGLFDLIVSQRSPVTVWVAERLDPLSPQEVFSIGAKAGRDVNYVLLESFWRNHRTRFVSFARCVADKRADAATEGDVLDFSSCLQDALNEDEYADRLDESIPIIRNRMLQRARSHAQLAAWASEHAVPPGSRYETVVAWRCAEIAIERELRKRQHTFEFVAPEEASDVKAAAEAFLAKELDLPVCFGFDRLCGLASYNIEQFLALAGQLFEHIQSRRIVSFPQSAASVIVPGKQDQILRKAIDRLWSDVPRRIPNAPAVRAFLTALAEFCASETFQPNAPYSPGVTGVGLRIADRDELRSSATAASHPDHLVVAQTISSCISQNLLEPVDIRCKGEDWCVLYLNRAICAKFSIPLQYGGWRPRTLLELSEWVQQGKPVGSVRGLF